MKGSTRLFWTAGLSVVALSAGIAGADSDRCSATCSISEISRLDFGTLQLPASGSAMYTVSPDGSGARGTATVLYGTATRGQYKITRGGSTRNCHHVVYDVQNVASGSAGVILSHWKGNLSGKNISLPYTSDNLPASGSTLYIGATLTLRRSAAKGSFSPSYTIACTIE